MLAQAETCLASNEAAKALEMATLVLSQGGAARGSVAGALRPALECQANLTLCKALVQLGEWARAFHACKQALGLFPMQHELLYLSGKVLLECGQYAEAVVFFGYAIEAKPDHLPSWLARGLTYHTHLKDFAHAVADFHTSIVLNPTYYKTFFYMGLAMSDLARFDLALEAYGRSIHLNATFSESYFRRGVLHLQHHRLEEAVADFSAVTQLVPESAEAHYNCALAQHLLKRNEDAIHSYSHCLKYQPSYVNALKNCAHAQSELGLYTEAFENYSTALTLPELDETTQLDILLARGQVSERNQDFEQALADYTRAIALRPSLGRAFTCRGLLYLQRSDLTLALADFTESIALEPENARAWNNRGTVLLQCNQLQRALADFDRALELCPTLPKALRNRGKTLYLLQQLAPALQTLNTAAQQPAAQSDPEIYICRGLVHSELGHTAKALKDFGRAPEPLRKRHARLEQTELLAWLNLDFGTGHAQNPTDPQP